MSGECEGLRSLEALSVAEDKGLLRPAVGKVDREKLEANLVEFLHSQEGATEGDLLHWFADLIDAGKIPRMEA